MVLELARPSEARCSPPGRYFFEAVLLQQPQATEGNRSCRKMLFFEDFRRHVRQFFGVVLELASPSATRCFPPGGDFFEAVLLQQPQATEAVEKGCFSRILDDTLGTFSAPFLGFSALHWWCLGLAGPVFSRPGRCKFWASFDFELLSSYWASFELVF